VEMAAFRSVVQYDSHKTHHKCLWKRSTKHQPVQLILDGIKENHYFDWVTFKFTLLTLHWQPQDISGTYCPQQLQTGDELGCGSIYFNLMAIAK
jgi:hypothetical protein